MFARQRPRRDLGIHKSIFRVGKNFSVGLAAHFESEGKKQRGERQNQNEQADHVLALKHTIPCSPRSSSRCHAYFCDAPRDLVHWLMISMGSGNTIVVFFSTP